jgi:uncharacterized membrane protein YgcG
VAFVVALGLAKVVAAALSPAKQALLAPIHVSQLHRIFNRLTMIGVLAATVWLLVHNGLATREVLGFAVPPRVFARQALLGLVSGLTLMVVVMLPLFALGVRDWNDQLPASAAGLLALGFKAVDRLRRGAGRNLFRGGAGARPGRIGAGRRAARAAAVQRDPFFGEAVQVPLTQ